MRRFVYLFKRVLTHGTLRFNTVRCEQKEQQVVKIDVAFSRVTTVNDTCVNDQCEMDVHARLSKQKRNEAEAFIVTKRVNFLSALSKFKGSTDNTFTRPTSLN